MKPISPVFKVAESESEYTASLKLVADVFSSHSGICDYEQYKGFLWREDPTFDSSNLILAMGDDGEIIGVIRIVPRVLYRIDQPIVAAGISSVCLKEEYRGRGLSTPMMHFAMEECRRRGYDIAVLFSRRVLDHYYCRFGFWGVASYSQICFGGLGTRCEVIRSELEVAEVESVQYEKLDTLYRECYETTFGYVERSSAYWQFMRRRIEYVDDLAIKAVLLDGAIVGYFMLSGDTVCELAADVGKIDLVDFIRCIEKVTEKDINQFVFNLSPQHAMMASSKRTLDKTVSNRSCSYGGNMACILGEDKIFSHWIDRLNQICIRIRIPPFSGRFSSVEYSWDGNVFSASLQVEPPVLDYETTCLLLGCETTYTQPLEVPFLLDREPFNIPLADHF